MFGFREAPKSPRRLDNTSWEEEAAWLFVMTEARELSPMKLKDDKPKDEEQQAFGFVGPANHRLRRGVYLLPSAFTVANLLCGYYAVLATLKGGPADLDNASRAIGFAILFD